MRIDHSTNIDLISLQAQQTELLPQSVPRRQTVAELDSSSHNAESTTIIDAEYVEIFSTGKPALPPGPNDISSVFDTDAVNQNSAGQQRVSRYNPLSRYQEMAAGMPMPGKYLNIFA